MEIYNRVGFFFYYYFTLVKVLNMSVSGYLKCPVHKM